MSKKSIARLATAVAIIGSFVAAGTGTVQAVPSTKVKICHRTHSVTNPYVMITVSQNSVGSGTGKHGGNSHDQWSTVLFTTKPSPNVFNPAVTYKPSPEKKWGDIIAFADVNGNPLTGNAAQVQGLNNTGIGAQIFAGTGQYAGLCTALNARDYYELEVANGQKPADVLDEMDKFEADEFASALSNCGGTFIGCTASKLGTTTITVTTTTTLAPAGTLPPGVALTAGKGAVTVKIWVDANRNGKKASAEKSMKGVTVKITDSSGVTKTATTDANGNATFTDLTPGKFTVKSILTTDGYEKVYDSDGSVNWTTSLDVVADTVSAVSYAAATSSAVEGGDSLVTVGSRSARTNLIAGLVLLGAGLVLVRRRRTI